MRKDKKNNNKYLIIIAGVIIFLVGIVYIMDIDIFQLISPKKEISLIGGTKLQEISNIKPILPKNIETFIDATLSKF